MATQLKADVIILVMKFCSIDPAMVGTIHKFFFSVYIQLAHFS
jgi:hypothetical protein